MPPCIPSPQDFPGSQGPAIPEPMAPKLTVTTSKPLSQHPRCHAGPHCLTLCCLLPLLPCFTHSMAH